MTIALGILCADGIVLCADSQETLAFAKVNRPKVFELKTPDGMSVVLAGSGDGVFLDALKDKVESALNVQGVGDGLDSIHVEIEATVAGYCERIWKIYGDHRDRPDAEMLIGVRAQDGLALLHCDGPTMRRVSDYESIGLGGDFSTYHLKQLFNPKMSINQACPLAVHVLEVAKDNVDGCGGPSQVYVISATGDVEKKDTLYVEQTAGAFEAFRAVSDRLLARTPSLRFKETELFAMFVEIYEKIPQMEDEKEKSKALYAAAARLRSLPDFTALEEELKELITTEELQEITDACNTIRRYADIAEERTGLPAEMLGFQESDHGDIEKLRERIKARRSSQESEDKKNA